MRSTPQVIGAARDQLRWTREQIEIEANGVGDNPIFLPEDQAVLTGANFQGTPVSLPIDTLGAAITMICVLSERRLNRLTNPALSVGLAALPHQGRRHVLRHDAEPVHSRHADRRTEDPLGSRVHSVHPRRRRPGRLRLHGHELLPEDQTDPRQSPTASSGSS